jgi:hypothetical protein
MGALILLGVLVVGYIVLKLVWMSGFMAGKDHEAILWLKSIDKLFVPNWQSLTIGRDEGMNSEELEYANRIYVAAYRTALDHIKLDIAAIRREALEKQKLIEEAPERPV